MDLVSCRNLLIYMDTDLQAKVIPDFHYSLVPGGILLLGGSESAAQHADLFEPWTRPRESSGDVRIRSSPDLQLSVSLNRRGDASSSRAIVVPRTGHTPAIAVGVFRSRSDNRDGPARVE